MKGGWGDPMREKFASRLGFIFLSAGSAIGLGNVWRFPFVAGQNGGGWFVAIYLVCLLLIGLPVLVMEFAVGRASQRSIVRSHETITPEKPLWRIHGAAGLFGCTVLMMFYTTVTGWMCIYFVKSALGVFGGMTAESVGAEFPKMLADPLSMSVAMLAVTLVSAAVCSVGLQRGVERVTKWMMLCLLALIVVLAANSIVLDARNTGGAGVKFFLMPDFGRVRAVGLVKVVAAAMNQAFFTLSLGVGSMLVFGSYIGRDRSLLGEGLHVGLLDTLVAISAGLIVIPACFAYGVNPGHGTGLIFATLPNVFLHMPFGRLWGSLFFLFMCFAALTTVIAVFEAILACLMERFGWNRRKAGVVTGLGVSVLSFPCVLGFNVWSAFRPFGEGSCVLDLEDFVVSNLLLPLGGVAFALYCSHRFGWGWKGFVEEANEGNGLKIPDGRSFAADAVRFYCAYVLPLAVLLVFVLGIVSKFRP